ncbi:molybdopterin-dependent oxidoreductase [Ruania alba]|uniref:DMSO/TMAO reductase YedYZ, molybdopterin-dependent catalytic subunit n=1 Tax=Ruania alba TaxID=648782 RepID=A0A1H5BIW6_9MICO|nr:molybdopterin-dependent oxidoreductase [Ruania alba]SED54141.1 DMSO/TMAO reductase YedYZ, molybdopterin-dependent catalytic subunit [Ruania alba]
MPGTRGRRAAAPSRLPRARHALTGVVSAAAGIGVAHTVAALTVPAASPLLAVGSVAIDAAPTPVKEFAVRTFGNADKPVLLAGMAVVLILLTATLGLLASRRPWVGVTGMLALGAVAAAAALTRTPGVLAAVPGAVAGAVAAAGMLWVLAGLRGRTGGGADADSDGSPVSESPLDGPHVRTGRFVPSRRGVLIGGPTLLAAAGVGGGALLTGLRSGDAALGRDLVLPEAADPAAALPGGVQLEVPGMTPFRTASDDFYRVDIALSTPRIDVDTWSLPIGGLVDRPVTLLYQDILDMPLTERWITLTCVSNPVGGPYVSTGRWLGVPLVDLLEQVGVQPEADQIFTESADGLTMSIPLAAATDGRDAMLVVGLNGEQLPVERGFPARLIVPGLFGFVSAAKWLTDLRLSTYAADQAYWTERGWATDAPVLTQARIDVPGSLERVPAGQVTMAGVAWAQQRGVDMVEVRVDGGPWQAAELAADGGADLWRQWQFTWESTGTGRHDVQVRATDSTGATQPEERTDPVPDGARGWHSIAFMVED